MVVVLNIIDDDVLCKWLAFVEHHPDGNVFQTPMMYNAYLNTPGYKPYVFIAYQDNVIVGVLLSVVIKERGLIKGSFSARSVIIGGPLVLNNKAEFISELLKEYNKFIKDKVIYSQIRNQSEQLVNNDSYQLNGYKFHSHLNFIIPLDGEENIWNRIGKGRIKQIKKAQNKGLKVEVYTNDLITDALITEGYSVIQDVYKRARLPLVDKQLILNAQQNGLLVMFVVRDKDLNFIGCRFCLSFNKCLYGWYAGSYSVYYKLFPNDILIYETLIWGNNNGYCYFDYGGAGEPNKPYGVRSFKQQMGGAIVNYGRYEKVHKRLMYIIGYIGYKILKMIK